MLMIFLACTSFKWDTASWNGVSSLDTSSTTTDQPKEPELTLLGSVALAGLDFKHMGDQIVATPFGFLLSEPSTGILFLCQYRDVGYVARRCFTYTRAEEEGVSPIQDSQNGVSFAEREDSTVEKIHDVELPSVRLEGFKTLETRAASTVISAYKTDELGVLVWGDLNANGTPDLAAAVTSHTTDGAPPSGFYGSIAVFFDVEPGEHAWSQADLKLPACADTDRQYRGPLQIAVTDAALAVSCPGKNGSGGSVEGWVLPLSVRSADWAVPASGLSVSSGIDNGFVADNRGSGVLAISAEGESELWILPVEGLIPGTDPHVLEVDGRILFVAGSQPQIEDVDEEARGPKPFYGSMLVCDISAGWRSSRCAEQVLPDDTPAKCLGTAQGIVETAAGIVATSSGTLYGSNQGCGAISVLVE